MKRFLSIIIIAALALSLAGCGSSAADEKRVPTEEILESFGLDPELFSDYDYGKFYGREITLNVANWGEYMSINDDEMTDVNELFEALTGVEVNYKTYASNETMYSKLLSGGATYDIVIPSDYMISKMIKENMLEKLDFDNIPNIKNIMPSFLNPQYDPTNEYSVPYLWGMVCIIYNTTMVDEEIDSWASLWDEKYAGNILMFNNPRDAFGIAQAYLGYSLNTEDKGELDRCSSLLRDQKDIVQGYVMDEIFDKMEGGSAAIAPYYVGDAVTMCEDNPDLEFVIPKEGTNWFVDAVCIPTTSNPENKEVAEMYINFLCEPEIALANCDYVGYSTPVAEAYELLDDDAKADERRYPSDEFLLENTEVFVNMSDEANAYMQELWTQLKVDNSNVWFVPVFLVCLIAATIFVNVRRARKKKRDSF